MTLRPLVAPTLAALMLGAFAGHAQKPASTPAPARTPAAAQTPTPPPAATPASEPQATPPTASQHASVKAGPVTVPITVREHYLGRSGAKTAVKFILTASKRGLASAVQAQPRVYSFVITGEAKGSDGTVKETFRVPVEVDLSDADTGKPLEATFLKSLAPGHYDIQFRVEGVAGAMVAITTIPLDVPAMQAEFDAKDAGLGPGGLPSAAAVILESENREAIPQGASDLVKIMAPKKEVPIGLIRIDCEVKPPVTRVDFFLDDKKIVGKNRPPYTIELDLGKIPRKQTLKAIGFDAKGNFIDADAWAINEREARLAVRILELPPKAASDKVDLKVTVQSIAGGVAKTLKLFLDDTLVQEWNEPPYTASVPAVSLKRATLLRATVLDEEGKEFSDIKFLKGDSRFVSSVEVNIVELNVSVFDDQGRFQKGLEKKDFSVFEDGQPVQLQAFEFSESLPISLGIVIDGSGSMQESMALVHQAASEFVQKLVGEKDQGFVMEFREQPVVLAAMTKRQSDLVRAIAETRAQGGTAFYDSLVMGLYQFRAVPGKKAIVVLTDGKDNHSWTDYETLRRYARAARVPVYVIGLDLSFLEVGLKSKLNELADDTGGEAFFVGKASGLAEIYRRIESELRSQYYLTYETNSKKPEDQFRTVDVKMKNGKLKAKTIRGYFP
jgi:Ca-activated chloride channel homolog